MRPETITITRKDFENSVKIIVHTKDFFYALGERPSIYKWIFKKVIGRWALDEFQEIAKILDNN